ncbi:polysaccharide transporter [Curtobacterium sp. ER1/6]|uniref:polysaccharide transporter n=1 Tax=Curtobacterium sp. ER1/6 TaxID=1891920 RepID=UPI00114D292F|nr:polysaccharide transporter [Curtobacterium sp. ER1/6]
MLLLVLVTLMTATTGAEQGALVTGFALLGSFAMVFDSGASSFLLATERPDITTGLYRRAMVLQGALSTVGLGAATAFALVSAHGELSSGSFAVLMALGVTQLLDGLARVARAPFLVAARDDRYALPDLALLAAKVPLVAFAFVQADLRWLLLLPVPSLVVTATSLVAVHRTLPSGPTTKRRLELRILEFGATGALSAYYSQAPLVLGALIVPAEQLAPLGLVFRLVQALEVVPSTVSQQMIPRARAQRPRFLAWTGAFLLFGALVSVVLLISRDLLSSVLAVDFGPAPVFLLVALAYTLRSGNHYLVAILLGTGMVRTRLVIAAVTGALASVGALAAALIAATVGLAVVTIVSEVFLVTTAALAIHATNQRATVLLPTQTNSMGLPPTSAGNALRGT